MVGNAAPPPETDPDKPTTWGGMVKGVLAILGIIIVAGVAVIAFIWNALEQQVNYSPF